MSSRKGTALLAVVVLATAFLAGCGGGQESAESVLRYNLGTEPESLDSAIVTGQPEFTALNAAFEGLARLDDQLQPQPAMAESWEVSADSLVFTFHIRDGVTWTNGDPVTAEDFRYSWLRALAPETASEYAYQLWYIKGAFDYTSGTGSADAVGIEVLDETTLRVTLAEPAPYFLSLMAFPTYFPVHRATVEQYGEAYGAEAESLVTNGPFRIAKWEHRSVLEFVPFENYWDRDALNLDRVELYMVEEESTELAMFETGDLDILENVPLEEMARLKDEGLVIGGDLATYYYMFNVEADPFDDVRVRKAFALAIDRAQLVESVTQGGQAAAMAIVPFGIINPVSGEDFRAEGGDYFVDNDVAAAQALLAEAGYPNGAGLPAIEILTNDKEAHINIAQAIMEMWRTNLNVQDISVRVEEWGVYQDSKDTGDYQVARAGWGADYIDPMTFLDLWMTGSGNNDTNWASAEFDRLIGVARTSSDQAVRFESMHEAEELLLAEMPVIPIYFYTDPYMDRSYVKGVVHLPFGPSVEFKNASVEPH